MAETRPSIFILLHVLTLVYPARNSVQENQFENDSLNFTEIL